MKNGITIEMCDCENTILTEIKDKKFKRKDIALTYAFAIESSEAVDWEKVNMAIIERWSKSGLIWIKERAWKLIYEKEREHGKGNG